MEKQIGLFPERRTSVSNREKRNVVLTTKRIRWYQFALVDAILENEKRIEKSKESEAVKDTYRSIIKIYEAELEYLDKIMWEGEDVNGA